MMAAIVVAVGRCDSARYGRARHISLAGNSKVRRVESNLGGQS